MSENKKFPAKVLLAPMAGVTDLAFRTVCRDAGAEMTYTEMVSAKALCFGDKKTARLLQLAEDECPAAVQIFGSEPETMAAGAKLALQQSGAAYLDINAGCPVGKIVSNGEGSALMKSPQLLREILIRVIDAVDRPVLLKIRKGWDSGSINFIEIATIAQECGVAAICLHARTKTQMYSGTADIDAIRELKRNIDIPVIANGDIYSAEDALKMFRYTGADAIMIGRGAFGNPWIFSEIKAVLNGGEIPPPPTIEQRCLTAVRQFEIARRQKGERIACLEARKHYAWYLRGIPYAGYYKEQISKISEFDDIYKITSGIVRDLK